MKRGPKPETDVLTASNNAASMVPPEDLDPTGLEAWQSVCEDLERLGALHVTDRKLVEVYARTYSLFRRIELQMMSEELTIVCENSRMFINPLVTAHASVRTTLRQVLSDLCLSPKSRGKVNDLEDDYTEFMRKHGK